MDVDAFGLVVIVVSVTSALVAIVMFVRMDRLYKEIGKGLFKVEHPEDDETAQVASKAAIERQLAARDARERPAARDD